MQVLVKGDVASAHLGEEGGVDALEWMAHARDAGGWRRAVEARVPLTAFRRSPALLPVRARRL